MTAKLFCYNENLVKWEHIRSEEVSKEIADKTIKDEGDKPIHNFWKWEIVDENDKPYATINTVNPVLFDKYA